MGGASCKIFCQHNSETRNTNSWHEGVIFHHHLGNMFSICSQPKKKQIKWFRFYFPTWAGPDLIGLWRPLVVPWTFKKKQNGFWGTFGASNGCESNKIGVCRYTEKTSRNVLGICRVLSLTSTSTYVWRKVEYFSGSDHLRSPVFRYQCGEFQFHFILVQLKNLQPWTALSSKLLGCSWKWS